MFSFQVSLADIAFVCYSTLPENALQIKILSKYPKLQALRKRVEALPKIADWIKNRPQNPM